MVLFRDLHHTADNLGTLVHQVRERYERWVEKRFLNLGP